MNIAPDGTKEVNFSELWDSIAGGTKFTQDEVLGMMADNFRTGEDFRMIHNSDRYIIRHAALIEYFTSHPTPEKPMKAEEENKVLRAKLAEANRRIFELTSAGQAKPLDVNPVQPVPNPEEPEVHPVDKPVDINTLKNQAAIPFSSVAAELKAELQAKKLKPINR